MIQSHSLEKAHARRGLRFDLALAGLVGMILVLLIAPLPAMVLDLLLAANLGLAVLVMVTAISARSSLTLSTFPALLVVTTLTRLALNVSSTRLILGQAYAGEVINAFSSWVVGGSLAVGIAVFLILTLVQFVVVARGGERAAEVAARFALDALPGRQMAIDADLRVGELDGRKAVRRRQELVEESQLFGAMDGALKFVKGDAIAGLLILLIDLVGGISVGILERGLSFGESLNLYGRLTIGDGLVTQIPALILALSAALVVTRTSQGEQALGERLGHQLLQSPRTLSMVALFLGGLCLLPGLPLLPFAVLASLAGLGAWLLHRRGSQGPSVGALPSRWILHVAPQFAGALRGQLPNAIEALHQSSQLRIPMPEISVNEEQSDTIAIEVEGRRVLRAPTERSLQGILREALPHLLSLQDVDELLERWRGRDHRLVDEVRQTQGLFSMTRALRRIIAAGYSLQELRTVLEAWLEAPSQAPWSDLEELARNALTDQLRERLSSAQVHLLRLGKSLSLVLEDLVNFPPSLDEFEDLQGDILDAFELAIGKAENYVVLAPKRLRRELVRIISPFFPSVEVLELEPLQKLDKALLSKAQWVEVGESNPRL